MKNFNLLETLKLIQYCQELKGKEIWLVSFGFLLCSGNILKRKRDYQKSW